MSIEKPLIHFIASKYELWQKRIEVFMKLESAHHHTK